MDRVDAIYQRHVAALERIGACGDAVRLSLRLALEELEEGARGEGRGASIEERTAALHQMTKIGAWLVQHADGRGEGMEIADAMIAFAQDKLNAIQSLIYQVEAKAGVIQRIERVLEKHDSALYADLIAGNVELPTAIDAMAHSLNVGMAVAHRQIETLDGQLASARNGSHANPPYVTPDVVVDLLRADNIDAIRHSTWLHDEDRDWLEGLERGAHSFRSVPKETRRRLVQAHIDAVRTDSEAPRQFDFDQARPAWMPTAGSAAVTFGASWGDLCAAKDLPY